MARQPLYKYDFVNQLKADVKDDTLLNRYKDGDFPKDSAEHILHIANVNRPDNLCSQLIAIEQTDCERWKKDLEEAKLLFTAYKSLSRLQATDERLWTYLAHVDLFEFLAVRWPIPWEEGVEKVRTFIQNHWYIEGVGGLIRHPLAGLWWSVFTTYDEKRANPFELTDYYYELTTEFGIRRLGMVSFTDNKDAMLAILEYMVENPERIYDKHFRTVVVTQYFSRLGSVKCLASMGKEFFKNEMKKLDDVSKKFNTRNEVQSNEYLLKGIQ